MEEENHQQNQQVKSKKRQLRFYGKYAGMAGQMAAIILIFTYGGVKLDQYFETSPIFTIVLSFASVILAMYFAVRDLLKK